MKEKLAIKIYKYILEKCNGWDKESINKLTFEEFESDPIFEGLIELS